jgi:hypothetical protein
MRRGSILALISLCALLSACAKGPESVVKHYATSVANGDAPEALKDLDPKDAQTMGPKLTMAIGMAASQMKEKGGVKSVSTEGVVQNGDIATVKVKTVYGNGTENLGDVQLHKINGEWKVSIKW